ncbi:unnamed protein product [Effrenium voratum]|nr:unnamed protein product [Effrenium voratum]
MPSRSDLGDLVLPLFVTLEQFYCGAIRHVQVNTKELNKAGYCLLQETFEVYVPRGAPDGHRVTFAGKVTTGDVVFVLQEMIHPLWSRQGSHLFVKQNITLRQALTGRVVIEHLDGQKLLVRTAEVLAPREKLDAEAEWSRFDGMDSMPGQDAATLKTGDIEACKELCRCNGWFGFTYWEDRAYFRSQDRQSLLRNKRPSSGSILFIRPEVSNLQAMEIELRATGFGASSTPSWTRACRRCRRCRRRRRSGLEGICSCCCRSSGPPCTARWARRFHSTRASLGQLSASCAF